MPKVSIIVPNYNHAKYLPQRIDSILNQTYTDYELILMDDKSLDNSDAILREYAEKYPHIKYYPNERNSGTPFHQWNKGADLAKGEYLWMAESDDFCEPTLLEKLVRLLDENPKCGIAYAQTYLVDEEGEKLNSYLKNLAFIYKSDPWEKDFIKNGTEANRDWLIFHNPIPNASGALIRKEAFINTGKADPNMKLNGDWYVYAKILSEWDLAFCAEHLNFFRVHAQTQRSRSRATHSIYNEILKLNYFIRDKTPDVESNANEALRKVANWWTGSLAHQKWTAANFKGNINLYFTFQKYRKGLLLNIVFHLGFTWLRNILIALGVLKPLKNLRNKMFPGKYFEH